MCRSLKLGIRNRDKGTKGQRDKGTKGQRDKGTKGQSMIYVLIIISESNYYNFVPQCLSASRLFVILIFLISQTGTSANLPPHFALQIQEAS